MTLSDAEKGSFHRMREVSELRVQYQCEYRLYLKQKLGEVHSKASSIGLNLHTHVSKKDAIQHVEKKDNLILLLIVIMTLIAGYLWIFG